MIYAPHNYQQTAIDFLSDRLVAQPAPCGAGLFLDPGLGKTSITLYVLQLLKSLGEMESALIVAPLRVCRSVWPAEVEKWGFDLSVAQVIGTPTQRRKALASGADVKVINPEGMNWLSNQPLRSITPRPFDTLVIDESTKFKNWGAKRNKTLRKLLPWFDRRMILTGTPAPNSYADLHAQMFLIDNGESLGVTQSVFRKRYMSRGGFKGRVWSFDTDLEDEVNEAISPLVLRMSCKDYLDMPEKVEHTVPVELPSAIAKEYRRMERELFMQLDNGEELTASSAGAMYMMCRSIANGGAYVGEKQDRQSLYVHNTKVEAAADIVEELAGKPALIAYQFQHDRDRLLAHKMFKGAPVIAGGVKPEETDALIRQWNAGDLPVLLCQPQSMSHGLNMQESGNDIIWFGLSDSREEYDQLNARLWRQGVKGGQVRIHRIVAKDTVDEAIIERIGQKGERQEKLLNALANYRGGKTK